MKDTAISIVKRLREAGHTAYFNGGCVRDMVRGVEPEDIDIATSAAPEQVQALFTKTVPVGAAFGVVLVLEDGHQFEVATFRSDDAYVDGRRPSAIHFASPEEDAQRRDFTINGLFFDPLISPTSGTGASSTGGTGVPACGGATSGTGVPACGPTGQPALPGQIIDYVGGRADIERKLVRTIGDPRERFTEDKLRLLRCVRFAANLGYEIEPATLDVVKEMASQITVVSTERIRDELVKILTRPHAGRGLELLDASGLLREILPEIAAMKGVEQPPEFHPEGDVFQHTKLMLDMLSETARPAVAPYHGTTEVASRELGPPNDRTVLALAVLLHDVGKPPTFVRAPDRIRFNYHDRIGAEMTIDILKRLRFSNDEIEKVTVCVREHMKFQFVKEMRPAKLKRLMARDTFPDELELHRIDCASSHRNLENYEFLKAKAAEMPPEVLKPQPLLTGHDLLAMGLKPGPLVGKILHEVEELQLEERLKTRDEALEFAKTRVAAQS